MNMTDAARLSEAGKLQEAEAACREAIFVDASDAEAHHLLGLVLRRAGRMEDALEALR